MRVFAHISEAKLKLYKKLSQKKYREKEGLFLVEGIHLVEEALSSGWNIESVLVTDAFTKKSEAESVLRKIEQKGCKLFFIKEKELISLAETVTPQGIVAVVHKRSIAVDGLLDALPSEFIVVALENISDPGNVGTILRTCDWFGVDAVLLDTTCVEVYNPKVLRASMGAVFHLLVTDDVVLPDVLLKIKKRNTKIVVTEVQKGTPLESLENKQRMVLVFGNEARGVSKEIISHADEIVRIPKYGKAESLNVGVACGVVVGWLRMHA